MKLIDRIVFTTYWITIIFILTVFVLMPIIFINVPDSFKIFTENNRMNPYYLTFSIISFAVIFLWGYCLWFWYKNDKYSKSIFLLLLFSWVYAPIYYYRVKIKKRPLRNKLKIKEQKKQEYKGIDEKEFIELTRENIISVLQLWTSKEKQLEYQNSSKESQVSYDLFEQWNDFYTPKAEVMKQAFDENELELLEIFDKKITEKAKDLNNSIPELNEFVETSEWKELNLLSERILTDLK